MQRIAAKTLLTVTLLQRIHAAPVAESSIHAQIVTTGVPFISDSLPPPQPTSWVLSEDRYTSSIRHKEKLAQPVVETAVSESVL